jgi:ribonuclease Z
MHTKRLVVSGGKLSTPDLRRSVSLARCSRVSASGLLARRLMRIRNRSRLLVNCLCRKLGLQSFTTVNVTHSTKCHGVIMKHSDGWSIVFVRISLLLSKSQVAPALRFSGDTTPSDRLIWAGTNATLLIHEATMGDDEIEMAKSKRHSTFGQAVDVGRK